MSTMSSISGPKVAKSDLDGFVSVLLWSTWHCRGFPKEELYLYSTCLQSAIKDGNKHCCSSSSVLTQTSLDRSSQKVQIFSSQESEHLMR